MSSTSAKSPKNLTFISFNFFYFVVFWPLDFENQHPSLTRILFEILYICASIFSDSLEYFFTLLFCCYLCLCFLLGFIFWLLSLSVEIIFYISKFLLLISLLPYFWIFLSFGAILLLAFFVFILPFGVILLFLLILLLA